MVSLKTEVDKLNIGKLAPVPVDLSKLSDVVKNVVVKKTVFDKLAAKANDINTSEFVLKSKYQKDKIELVMSLKKKKKKTHSFGQMVECSFTN